MTDLFGNQEMKALSWKEPFATLMLHGKIETRTWATNYRGLVLICASKKPYTEMELLNIAGELQTQRIFNFLNNNGVKEQSGYAIAVGKLVHCREMLSNDADDCFIRWNRIWCHIYENVRPIKPIPFKGQQGWKKLEPEFINKIQYLTNPTPNE